MTSKYQINPVQPPPAAPTPTQIAAGQYAGIPPPPMLPAPPPEQLGGLRFEDLPLEEQLSLSVTYQKELKSRPSHRRGPGAKSSQGGDCTRYFKRTNPNTGKTEWKVLSGQPCGPDAKKPPKPTPPPPPLPSTKPPLPSNCSAGRPYEAHIQEWRQLDPNSSAALSNWNSRATSLLRTELPLCAQFADQMLATAEGILASFGESRAAMTPRVAFVVRFIDQVVAKSIRSDRPPQY